MTFNIRHGVGCDGCLNLRRIERVIRQEQPDLVGLNEVDIHFHRRSGYQDQMKELALNLGMEGYFAPAFQRKLLRKPVGQYGNGMLVKHEVLEIEKIRFPGYGDEPRSLLALRLCTEGREFMAVVTHIGLSPWIRRIQFNHLMALYHQYNGPMIVTGDWNVKPSHPRIASLSSFLTDVQSAGGSHEGTYPCSKPKRRIDYIFCSHHFQVEAAWVCKTPDCPSDHLPVAGVLQWKQGMLKHPPTAWEDSRRKV